MRIARSWLLAVSVLIAATMVAACGGSSTVTVTKTIVQPPGRSATNPTTPVPTTTTTTTTRTATTPVAAGTACTASDLTPTFLGSNGAAGTIVLGFALKNTGSTTCHTYGWPGVEFLSSSGGALATNATRSTSDVVGRTPANQLTLKPGEEASFRIVASDVPTGGGSCPTAAKLQIYAPDDTVTMVVGVPGVAACGKASVSPMMPGESAFAGQGGGGSGGSGGSGGGSGSGQAGVSGSGGSSTSGGSSVSG